MTAAERKVRERYPDATCERTVAAFVAGDGFRVYAWGGGGRWIIGRGATPEDAWPLRRGKPLSRGTKGLKRTPFKRPTLPDGAEALAWSTLPRENKRRKAKARAENFGPHGDIIVPRLPCVVSFPWFYNRSDAVLQQAMVDVFEAPDAFAVISEPAHTKTRGAGGRRWDLVPLAPLLHAEQHGAGIETFQTKYGLGLPALAARLWRLSPARALEES